MNKNKKLVIVGDSSFAEVAFEYFQYDSSYEVFAFSVEKAHIKKNEMKGLPLVPFEELSSLYPTNEYEVYVAVVYSQLNRLRTRLYQQVKKMGYKLASYISPRAFIWKNVTLGEHCFIFENNVVQPFVNIGNNVVLWSGNHIGHHSTIGDNCFISSHVVISGHCNIGDSCFFGVNATIADRVNIGKDVILGAGVVILKDAQDMKVYKSDEAESIHISSHKIFKVKDTQGSSLNEVE